MKFFMPAEPSSEVAEKVWTSIRHFADETMGGQCTDRRIFSVRFEQDGEDFEAEVGRILEDHVHEVVVAILESEGSYFVCTPSRGVLRGTPYLVGSPSARCVVEFEREGQSSNGQAPRRYGS